MELSERIHIEWGKRIRRARREKEMATETFAESVGISRTHLYRIEKGIQVPSTAVRLEIARALGQDANTLFSYDIEDEQ